MPSSERPQSLNSRAATLFGGPQRLAQLFSVARILIVDDEVANVRLLGEMLKRSGFAATVGLSDSRQLERQFETTQPDLVLLDLHMPHRDGFAVLEALSPWIVAEHLPVCVITGDMSLDVRRKVLALGARDFITKPFDLMEVVLRVRNLLETRLLYQDLRKQNRTLLETVHGRTTLAESIAFTHHERWDGGGYPQRLRGDAIPIEGRIVAVADTFDALTHNRPYRKARSVREALIEIEQHSGTQFDATVVNALLHVVPRVVDAPQLAMAV